MSGSLRFDYYQTDTAVTVTVFAKGVKEESVKVDIGDRSLSVAVQQPDGSEAAIKIDPLYSSVQPQASAYKVLSTKIEVSLNKAAPGLRWPSLQGEAGSVVSGDTPAYTAVPVASTSTAGASSGTSAAPAAAKRSPNKWDRLDYDDMVGDSKKEGDINSFFQKIYADASDDAKRAMMKSFQESNGTTLSTNWSEVGKGPVPTQPPDGMEARKYEM